MRSGSISKGEYMHMNICSGSTSVLITSAYRSITRELPHNVPFKAKVALIQRPIASWDGYSAACFETVHSATLAELKALAHAHFSRYGTTLPDAIDIIVEGVIERLQAKVSERLQWMLELENPPFTNNDHYFTAYREKYLTRYKDARKVR